MSTVIGIDLGGTKTALGVYDTSTWEQKEDIRRDTHAERTFTHVYKDLLEEIQSIKQKDTVAVGIGVPGLVSQPEGVIYTMPNIDGGEKFPLKKRLEADTGLRVFVDNDANCFTLAEALLGAGRGSKVCVGITMGTGVGGGIVIDGTIFHGGGGFAGEIGHMLLKPGDPPYETDDKRGDVEQFLSGTAFSKRCLAAKDPRDYLEGEACEFMRPEVFREIAWMCTTLIHVLDPHTIVFGGSAGRALTPHLSAIETELKKWLLPHTPLPKLAVAELKNAATLGAAIQCRSAEM